MGLRRGTKDTVGLVYKVNLPVQPNSAAQGSWDTSVGATIEHD